MTISRRVLTTDDARGSASHEDFYTLKNRRAQIDVFARSVQECGLVTFPGSSVGATSARLPARWVGVVSGCFRAKYMYLGGGT